MLSTKWQSSLLSVNAGFSTYASNSLESFFGKLDAFEPSGEQHRDVSAIFTGLSRFGNTQRRDKAYQMLCCQPSGPNILVPRLLRGAGPNIAKGGLHDCSFRITVVDKMIKADSEGRVFFLGSSRTIR